MIVEKGCKNRVYLEVQRCNPYCCSLDEQKVTEAYSYGRFKPYLYLAGPLCERDVLHPKSYL